MDGSLTRFMSETSSLPQRSSQLGEQHSIFSYMDQRAPALRCSRPNQSKEVVRVPGPQYLLLTAWISENAWDNAPCPSRQRTARASISTYTELEVRPVILKYHSSKDHRGSGGDEASTVLRKINRRALWEHILFKENMRKMKIIFPSVKE